MAPRPATSDFNGDGHADLALGVPREDVNGIHDVGAVNVIYGSSIGLTANANQLWYENAPGVPGVGESSDLTGFALATGDFDGDGYADLAIGTPFEDVGSVSNAGGVTVLYGSGTGLAADRGQLWDQGVPGVPDGPEPGDQFGYSVVAGDLNGDGFAELVIGVQREDVRGAANAGEVEILDGSSTGLVATGAQTWSQGPGIADDPEHGDQFGAALATGDLDGDGFADLAAGAPFEDLRAQDEGAVNVLYGSATGLSSSDDQRITQRGLGDPPEAGDQFGMPLSSGDIDADGFADLVVAAFLENVSGRGDAGAFNVLMGSATGLTPASQPFWTQDTLGVPGSAGTADAFAKAIALGDLNGDGFDDVAGGARYDDEAGPNSSGAVDVLYGSSSGLWTTGAQLWTQDSPGVPDVAETEDHFGSVLAAGKFASSSSEQLAVGVHFEVVGGVPFAGEVNVIPGSPGGLTGQGAQLWTQDSPGILEQVDSNDFFPFALAAAA
jgi:hypothetical protein